MQRRVVLAEDEPNIVESLRFVLGRAGFAISAHANGKDALAAVLEQPPSVLVLDVMLPGLNGFEVLSRLRADDRTRDLPILMLTAKGQREDRERALREGANFFLSKPFGNAELVDAVQKLVRRSEAWEAP